MNQFSQNSLDNNSLVYEKMNDALTPGFYAEFDPDEAQQVGAFLEDALTIHEASDSCSDSEDNV